MRQQQHDAIHKQLLPQLTWGITAISRRIMSEHRFSEIVIERPRSGMRMSSRKLPAMRQQLAHITQEATVEGLLSPYLIKTRNKTKWLSDHLGPLRRFLRSHVGQPWDQVHHKLCKRLDQRTLAGQHVIGHLWDYVERHVDIHEGVPRPKHHGCYFNSLYGYGDRFYVHPDTGILCLVEKKPHQPPPAPKDTLVIDTYHEYRKINDLWYLITYADFPPFPVMVVRDMLVGQRPRQTKHGLENHRYAAQKKQCNKKEIRWINHQLNQA